MQFAHFPAIFNKTPLSYFVDDGPDTIVALSAQGDDVSYSTRHVEESWHHLMKSEDTAKFKQIAVCNFDFLLAAVSVEFVGGCFHVFFRSLVCNEECDCVVRDILGTNILQNSLRAEFEKINLKQY